MKEADDANIRTIAFCQHGHFNVE